MKTIRNWSDEIHQNAVDHGWWENGSRNIPELLMLVVSEVSEALEAFRRDEMETYYTPEGKPEGFWTELSDAVIRIMDLAGAYNVDLEHIIALKHEYNKTRSYRHGGKRA